MTFQSLPLGSNSSSSSRTGILVQSVIHHDRAVLEPGDGWNRPQMLSPVAEVDETSMETSPPMSCVALTPKEPSAPRQTVEINGPAISVERLIGKISRRAIPRTNLPLEISSRPSITDLTYARETKVCKKGQLSSHVEIVINLPVENDINPPVMEEQTSRGPGFREVVVPLEHEERYWSHLWYRIASIYQRFFNFLLLLNLLVRIGIVGKSERAHMV